MSAPPRDPAQDGTTAGQAAYEARMASRAKLLGHAYGIGMFNHPWHGLDEQDQAHEEAGANAAIDFYRADITPMPAPEPSDERPETRALRELHDIADKAGWRAAAPQPDLLALLGKATVLLWDTGLPGNQAAAAELRAAAGMGALT